LGEGHQRPAMASGVVVAGGRSTRFGSADKAVADLAGTPMVRRVADGLAGVVDELVVNCRADQLEPIRAAMAGYPLAVRYAVDDEPDRGPVAGIHDGLRAAAGTYAVVVACDMPFVAPALVEHLLEVAAGRDGAIPRLDDGYLQTTQAAYHAPAMADACAAALERGDRRVRDAVADLDYVVVDRAAVERVAGAESLRNLNTREAFAAAAEELE